MCCLVNKIRSCLRIRIGFVFFTTLQSTAQSPVFAEGASHLIAAARRSAFLWEAGALSLRLVPRGWEPDTKDRIPQGSWAWSSVYRIYWLFNGRDCLPYQMTASVGPSMQIGQLVATQEPPIYSPLDCFVHFLFSDPEGKFLTHPLSCSGGKKAFSSKRNLFLFSS